MQQVAQQQTIESNDIRLRVALAGELVFLAASDPRACGRGVSRAGARRARLWR